MKRTFKTALIALSILCMGGGTTRCDEETVAQLITIIGNLFNTGETYTYTGNATSQTLNGSKTTDGWRGTYINATDENPTGAYNFSGMQVSLNCSTTGTLTIPA